MRRHQGRRWKKRSRLLLKGESMTRSPRLGRMKVALVMLAFLRSRHLPEIFQKIETAHSFMRFDLLVFIDGPRDASQAIDQIEVANFFSQKAHLSWVKIQRRDKNLGIRNNLESALDFVASKYDCFMVVEDDCLVSEAGIVSLLSLLKSLAPREEQIMAVNSVGFANNDQNECWFFSDRLISWGWGSWSDIWREYRGAKFNFSDRSLKRSIPTHWTYFERWFVGRMYKRVRDLDSWAIPLSAFVREQGLVASPSRNFTKILGTDQATHARWAPMLPEVQDRPLPAVLSLDSSVEFSLRRESRMRSRALILGWLLWQLSGEARHQHFG